LNFYLERFKRNNALDTQAVEPTVWRPLRTERNTKAWLLKDVGLDNLQQGEAETPTPKAGELLVKVGAVSLNFRDKAIVDGIYEPHKVPKRWFRSATRPVP